MNVPAATYRLQFGPSFGFKQAAAVIRYLHELGISDIYASPIFKAAKGSTHGYDIVDPNKLNPELGSRQDFDQMMAQKQKYKMGWLQDIVPNHMAFGSDNNMLMDVLEKGAQSRFFSFFDIVWDHPDKELAGKVMVPLLAAPYGEVLASGGLRLNLTADGLKVGYYDIHLPLCLSTYCDVLKCKPDDSEDQHNLPQKDLQKLLQLCDAFDSLARQTFADKRDKHIDEAKKCLWELCCSNDAIRMHMEKILDFYNGKMPRKNNFAALDELLNKQFFKLTAWTKASEIINYRRFFYLNEFIGLCAEKSRVFEFTHQLISQFVTNGMFTGLRVDHIDGLYDPTLYLTRLREKAGDTFIVVEKILQSDEQLPQEWPIQGTTGYEFTARVNQLFCCGQNEHAFSEIYRQSVGADYDRDSLLYEKKKYVVRRYMTGEVRHLAHILKDYSDSDLATEYTEAALIEVIAAFPVYRTYIKDYTPAGPCRACIKRAVGSAANSNPRLKQTIDSIGRLLLGEKPLSRLPHDKNKLLHFIMKFQQLTGPAMAKGFEDTFLYCYNRLISLNEVGSNPACFGISSGEFHKFNSERAKLWPHSLNATGTHDTKRGEDVRARLNVLSEMPQQWNSKVTHWKQINKQKKARCNGCPAPDLNDEYFLYQTLIGALPFNEAQYEGFAKRVKEHFIKAVREAKVHTSWIEQNKQYENACEQFVDKLLVFNQKDEFWHDFISFQRQVAAYAVYNSLSQLLIKMTAVGVPDFYQGSELWDLNLVDPDNRRKVDFGLRAGLLAQIESNENPADPAFLTELLRYPQDGRAKMFLIYKVLAARRKYREIFDDGDYLPLTVTGRQQDNVIAFARKSKKRMAIAVATRFHTRIVRPPQLPVGDQTWTDARIIIPGPASDSLFNVITAEKLISSNTLPAAKVLNKFPVALLVPAE